jgi:hypothetical protein
MVRPKGFRMAMIEEKPLTRKVDGSIVAISVSQRRPAGTESGIEKLYAIEVDGELRGYVGYVKSHRSGIGWRCYSLLPRPTHLGSSLAGQVSSASVAGSSLMEIAKNFPGLVAKGHLPTLAEVDVQLAAADAENARREASYVADRIRRDEEQRVAEETRTSTIEGLENLRDRLGTKLTNFERAAVENAIRLLGKD